MATFTPFFDRLVTFCQQLRQSTERLDYSLFLPLLSKTTAIGFVESLQKARTFLTHQMQSSLLYVIFWFFEDWFVSSQRGHERRWYCDSILQWIQNQFTHGVHGWSISSCLYRFPSLKKESQEALVLQDILLLPTTTVSKWIAVIRLVNFERGHITNFLLDSLKPVMLILYQL